jgi:hypothetical protein
MTRIKYSLSLTANSPRLVSYFPLTGMIPPSLRILAEEGLVEGLEVLAFLVLLGIDHKVSPFAGTVDEQRIVVLFELHNG